MPRFFSYRALAVALSPAALAACGASPAPPARAAGADNAAPAAAPPGGCGAEPGGRADDGAQVFVEAMFANVRSDRMPAARAMSFAELAAEHRRSVVLSSHVLARDSAAAVAETDAAPPPASAAAPAFAPAVAGPSPLAPRPRAPGAGHDDEAFWAPLRGTRFGVTPHVTDPDRVRLELSVELKGVQNPFRAIVFGASGQTLAIDTGAGAAGQRLLMLVRADIVRNPGDLCRLYEAKARERDGAGLAPAGAARGGT